VELVLETVRHRSAGLSMPLAVEQARAGVQETQQSVYAGLRRLHPELRVQALRKPAVLALSRAIEDECCARAERPMLFAMFQRERHYRRSEERWKDLSRTARSAVVFARFETTTPGPPVQLTIPETSVLDREWILVCDAPDHPGCVAAWERPGTALDGDGSRRFETLWSVDPRVVRDAARLCARLAEQFQPGVCADIAPLLQPTPPPASPQAAQAAATLDRMLEYICAAVEPNLS
jgi:DICT domain-containing protein